MNVFTDIQLNLRDHPIIIVKTQLISINKANACLHLLAMCCEYRPRTFRR